MVSNPTVGEMEPSDSRTCVCVSDPGHQRGDGGQQGEEVGQRRSAALVSDEDGRVRLTTALPVYYCYYCHWDYAAASTTTATPVLLLILLPTSDTCATATTTTATLVLLLLLVLVLLLHWYYCLYCYLLLLLVLPVPW